MHTDHSMTLKDWIITMILLFIPIVNIVMLIIWAIDKQDTRHLFAKAYLIVTVVFIAIVLVFYILLFIVIFSLSA
ncbi:hypothetical protein [Pseudogracilibacillus auburnensis]|uniref:hypothetical protein n=1 Tax=Pseudogracilibacillus auburnensis TaxID=1494959 RepID=UPI001A96472F|nr:hypothetical protein [Pseudogracilibacillus auburnensis]MBO1005117.1 hypothetical protein [Pseudogracilibacillus auburnensis]